MIININSYMQFGLFDIEDWIKDNAHTHFVTDWNLHDRHAALIDILKVYPNIKTYNVVMNPWARAKYIYNNVKPDLEFEEFVMSWEPEQLPNSWRYTTTPQVDFIYGADVDVDYLLHAENLAEDIKRIGQDIGVSAPLHVQEVYPEYKEMYTQEMKDRIAELFAPDISILSYEF